MAVVAVLACATFRLVLAIPLQIINDNEVKKPVVVDIDPNSADCPQRAEFCIRLV